MKSSKSRCLGETGGGRFVSHGRSPPCQPHPSAFNRQSKVYTGHCNNSLCVIRSEI